MVKELKKKIEEFHMLEKGDRILIGLSGGADSVSLAQILCEFRDDYRLELAAVCCHHGLRGEDADLDVQFAEQFCRERNITFFKEYEDVRRLAGEKGISLEEAGREFRYHTFESIMRTHGYNKLAIAHNADDRAETMLFHLARGTKIAGLCTMEPKREFFEGRQLIRPLLWTKKTEIENWLRERNISWRVDGTNQEDIYTRNRIRHHILPALTGINDRAVEHMGETAEQLSEVCSYLKEEENRIYDKTVTTQDGCLNVAVPVLKDQHSYMQKSILYRCICQLSKGRKDITSSHVKAVLDLLHGETGKEVHLLHGIRAWREYDVLFLGKRDLNADSGRENRNEEILDRIEVVLEKYPYEDQEISKNEYTKHFDCAKIHSELCLRFWQEGDYIFLKEDGGKKKLNRYFIDNKIPSEMRNQIPLLADGSHILWIVGHRISAYYKVTEDTKEVLSVTIKNKG